MYFLSALVVHADNNAVYEFYEAEYIDGIYMNKYQYSNNTIYYQKARFFRRKNTNEFAYCIEPFQFFNDNSTYTSTLTPDNLSNKQKETIEKIAHFGYGYKNHTDNKWYAITQMMIWREAGSNDGDFYFSNTLNGEKVNLYQAEIDEINNLIKEYDTNPTINNETFYTVEGINIAVTDTRNVLKNYKTDSNIISVSGSTVNFNNPKKGEYEFTFTRNEDIYNKPTIFYQTNNGQNLMETGNINSKQIKFKIIVLNTKINITKIDKDTQSINPSGEGELDGTTYEILNSSKKVIGETTIKDNISVIENIKLGTYYIKEKSPGKGYKIDENVYEIKITKENPVVELILENEIIKKKIKIEKKYGENNIYNSEKNIDFEIYNSNNELIKTVSTDDNGQIEIELPYGTYRFVQLNSTNGYSKVDPFTINVDNEEEEIIELKDYKIPVPNTKTKRKCILGILVGIMNLLIKLL